MQGLLRARESKLEAQCKSEVSFHKGKAIERGIMLKEVRSRNLALRHLIGATLRAHTLGSPEARTAHCRHPNAHILDQPVFNPYATTEQQTDPPPATLEAGTECLLINAKDMSMSMIGGVLWAELRAGGLRALARWQDNLHMERFLRNNVGELYKRELARQTAILTQKHEAERKAQVVLMHHSLQSTHNAALSLEQQLSRAERAGRVYMLRNVFVRQYYGSLQRSGDRGVVGMFRLNMLLDHEKLGRARDLVDIVAKHAGLLAAKEDAFALEREHAKSDRVAQMRALEATHKKSLLAVESLNKSRGELLDKLRVRMRGNSKVARSWVLSGFVCLAAWQEQKAHALMLRISIWQGRSSEYVNPTAHCKAHC